MTGYARVQGQDEAMGWVWEIKTVNARGLEIRTRLAPGFDGLDIPLRDALQKRFKRGSVSVSLTVSLKTESLGYGINEALLHHYVAVARKLMDESGGDFRAPSIDGLMALRGVIDAGEGALMVESDEARRAAMMDSFKQALEAVAKMRAGEGERLAQALRTQLAEIEALVGKAEGVAALDPAFLAQRLRLQVEALIDAIPALPEDRLMQEVALILARADVREELDRLRSHLAAAADMMAASEAVGRRLDFLCQEFNREANTLCSKAGSVELTGIGMALKAVIEQFREQVQNIE